jgi:hypothetical protein
MHELGWSASNNLCRLAEKIAPHFYTTYTFLENFIAEFLLDEEGAMGSATQNGSVRADLQSFAQSRFGA